jgi:hypothetical protein
MTIDKMTAYGRMKNFSSGIAGQMQQFRLKKILLIYSVL